MAGRLAGRWAALALAWLNALDLGRVVVALPPARGARPAPAVGHGADLRRWRWWPSRRGGRGAWAQLLRTPALWVLVLAAGTTNATFNWGVTIGDVVRVVLLFYLMPLWAVLLARLLLGEPLTARRRAARGAGAGRRGGRAVARRAAAGRCRRSLADWLGVIGGFSLRAQQRDAAARGAPARGGARAGDVRSAARWWPARWPWRWPCTGSGARRCPRSGLRLGRRRRWPWRVAFLAGNLALQYGAARLPANVTAVVMLTEVLFAAGSARAAGCRHADAAAAAGRRADRRCRAAVGARLSVPAPSPVHAGCAQAAAAAGGGACSPWRSSRRSSSAACSGLPR